VIVPSAMSWICASLHVSFGFAIVGAIVGEFVGARYGIGLLINIAKGSFDSAGMYAAIVIIMLVALVAEYARTLIENRLAKWRPARALISPMTCSPPIVLTLSTEVNHLRHQGQSDVFVINDHGTILTPTFGGSANSLVTEILGEAAIISSDFGGNPPYEKMK
jgi:Binding-protein-dependent transport system inner membrane component